MFCWNCCGAGYRSFLSSFKSYSDSFRLSAAVVVEPKISGVKAAKVIDKLGFDSNFRVDAIGFKGGVWLAWNSNLVSFDIVQAGKQFIHAKGASREGSVFFLTVVYASPKATERVLLWDALKTVAASITDPWAVIGDFNSILSANDKRGGAGFVRARNKSFIDTVDLCGLSNLPFQGPKFTWARNNVLVRLDRALVNDRWLTVFPESRVLHLHKLKSDHRPILLRSNNQVYSPYTKPFRFLSAWLSHPSFKFVLKRKWSRGADLPLALNNLTTDLRHWNKFVFGNIFRRKQRLTEELKKAEDRSSSFPSLSNLADERAIRSKLEAVLWQEDALWVQKSRSKWISDGDRNTSYFHLTTLRRRAFNRISRLKDGAGNWITGQPELLSLAIEYFKQIYCSRDCQLPILQGFSAKIDQEDRVVIGRTLSVEEIFDAIKSMGALKAPGKDGFCPLFYQSCWETVGQDFSNFVMRCFQEPNMIAYINETLITLIPKCPIPTGMSDFRPISLCNVAYKTITKCIANRLKGLMGSLTHPSQTSFVPGRHITDNILIIQEVVHSLSSDKGGKPSMVIKVDLSKL
ncbi:LINE-1 retrotransposable element ORF2 protein [Linum perenne]